MPRRSDTRSRMIDAASELFGCRGYHATAFSDVIEQSGAPRGSIYFHFPGGKQELAREAIVAAGEGIEETVAQAASRVGDPGSLIRVLAEGMVARLEDSGYEHGCSIATMVLELAPQDEELSVEFDRVFARWRAGLVGCFETWGMAPEGGVALADLVMSAFEGALILSRAARSPEPFWSTVEALVKVVEFMEQGEADSHAKGRGMGPAGTDAGGDPGSRAAQGAVRRR